MSKKTLAMAAVTAVSLVTAAHQAFATTQPTQQSNTASAKMMLKNRCAGWPKKGQERCFGIAKKGMNLCRTATHKCAGFAKADGDPSEWVDVTKGTCKRIVGGRLASNEDGSSKS